MWVFELDYETKKEHHLKCTGFQDLVRNVHILAAKPLAYFFIFLTMKA